MKMRFLLNDFILFHKIVNHIIPVKMPNYLSLFSGNSRLRSCHLDRLCYVSSVLPKGNSTNNLNKSFFYRSHMMWNSLSLELREIMCPSTFKKKLRQHLWNITVNELTDTDIDTTMSEGIT